MRKDLYAAGDNGWNFEYPAPDRHIPLGEPRIYNAFADQLLIISYGNGIPMSLQAAQWLDQELGIRCRIMDLRWLLPLNEQEIVQQARQFDFENFPKTR